MGIAKWRLTHDVKSDKNNSDVSRSPDKNNKLSDLERVYSHARLEKSFESENQKLQKEKYDIMKLSRQQKLKPISSLGIKKFSKQYEKLRKVEFDKKHDSRIKSETKEPYHPPKFTKIAHKWFEEESLTRVNEEIKLQERKEANKKRDKYWLLVRDLHPPQVSEVKKTEMENLKSRTNNKRLMVTRLPPKFDRLSKRTRRQSNDNSYLLKGLSKEGPSNASTHSLAKMHKKKRNKYAKLRMATKALSESYKPEESRLV